MQRRTLKSGHFGFAVNSYELHTQSDDHITKKDDRAGYQANRSGTKKEVANSPCADEARHHEAESSD